MNFIKKITVEHIKVILLLGILFAMLSIVSEIDDLGRKISWIDNALNDINDTLAEMKLF